MIEAKKEGVTLTGVETQTDKYTKGLPRWSNPLPFAYQTTGIETRFTNGLDPTPRSCPVFASPQPKLLSDWLNNAPTAHPGAGVGEVASTFLAKLHAMPPLQKPKSIPISSAPSASASQSLAVRSSASLIK